MALQMEFPISPSTLHMRVLQLRGSMEACELAAQERDDLETLIRAMETLERWMDYQPSPLSSVRHLSEDEESEWFHTYRNHLNPVLVQAQLLLEDEPCEDEILRAELTNTLQLVEQCCAALPNDLTASTVSTPLKASPSGLSKKELGNILIVEDHLESQRALGKILRNEGHRVLCAASAAEAFALLGEHDVELILLDLLLPDMNGFDILSRLKSDSYLRSLPVIMVSGQSEKSETIRCIEAGAEDYLLKPVNQVLLRARINASLERKGWQDREQRLKDELERNNAFIRKTFDRYLSDEIVTQLLEDPHGLDLGGQLQNVSIVMTDICGFSTLCHELAPQQTLNLLNNYLGTLSDLILQHEGTIVEFIGDAILAIFGAPLAMQDCADRAVRCCIDMQRAMVQVNDKNRRDQLPYIETSIAVNTGQVVAGNIGSQQRSKFAVVGHAVNMTARIEEATGPGQIFISSSTLNALKKPVGVSQARSLLAKGCDEPLEIYDLDYRAVELVAHA